MYNKPEATFMKRRNWSADEKLAIVLEGIKEKRLVAEICQEHQISQSLFYRWRDKFFEGGKNALTNNFKDNNVHEIEIDKLQKIIGKQTIQIEILKKRPSYSGQNNGSRDIKTKWLYYYRCLSYPGIFTKRLLCFTNPETSAGRKGH